MLAKSAKRHKWLKIRKEIIDLSGLEVSDETRLQAQKIAFSLGMLDKNRCRLNENLFEFSNSLLGRYLGHILQPDFPETIFEDIAASLKNARKTFDWHIILNSMGEINHQCAIKISKLLGIN